MTTNQPDRLDRIETLLEATVAAMADSTQQSNERMTRIEQRLDESTRRSEEWANQFQQRLDESTKASDERANQFQQRLDESTKASDERLTRIEQVVESNNRFLSAFTQDMRRYIDTLENLVLRLDGVIATSNQDRVETNTRLSSIQRTVNQIARHLGAER